MDKSREKTPHFVEGEIEVQMVGLLQVLQASGEAP